MQRLYQRIFKVGSGDHKFLRCPYLQDNNFEVLCSSIALDKVGVERAGNIKSKPNGNGSSFITYSNKKKSGIYLDNSGYLITKWRKMVK